MTNKEYEAAVLKQIKLVFGRIPDFVGGNPYGGGKTYVEDGVERDSGLFEFGTEAELDEFISANRHCSYVKIGDLIY